MNSENVLVVLVAVVSLSSTSSVLRRARFFRRRGEVTLLVCCVGERGKKGVFLSLGGSGKDGRERERWEGARKR